MPTPSTKTKSRPIARTTLVAKKAASQIARPVAPTKPIGAKTKLKVIAALKRLHPMD